MSLIVFCIYKNMDDKASIKLGKKKSKNDKIKQDQQNREKANADVEMSKIKTGINWVKLTTKLNSIR